MTTREQTHIALERFRTLTESLIEGIQESLHQTSRASTSTSISSESAVPHTVTLVKDFSPVIGALAECEKSIRSLIARARRQEQIQRQTDKVKDAIVRNEERLVKAVFFPAHEVDGCLRRAVNKSRFVCGTKTGTGADTKESGNAKSCMIDPESLSSYLTSVRFMAPPSLKLFRYDESAMLGYSVCNCACVDEEYKDHMATSAVAAGENGGCGHAEDDDEDDEDYT